MGNYWLHDIDETGKSPLTRASHSGRSELTTVMLMQETLDVPDHIRGLPDLHRAACWGFDDAIDDLIVNGANPDLRDDSGETPLHKAARLGHLRAVKCLLAHEADVNARDNMGMTPLHWAAFSGKLEIVETLIEYFADVDARDYFTGGISPREAAGFLGYSEVAERLQRRISFI